MKYLCKHRTFLFRCLQIFTARIYSTACPY